MILINFCLEVLRSLASSYDLLVLANSYQKNYVVIVRSLLLVRVFFALEGVLTISLWWLGHKYYRLRSFSSSIWLSFSAAVFFFSRSSSSLTSLLSQLPLQPDPASSFVRLAPSLPDVVTPVRAPLSPFVFFRLFD